MGGDTKDLQKSIAHGIFMHPLLHSKREPAVPSFQAA